MEGMKIDFPNDINILATLFSPIQTQVGILIAGEDYYEGSAQPVIRIYLMESENDEWFIQDELQAFAFWNFESAQRFVNDLPEMSAIDMMLLMNGGFQQNTMGLFQ